jgi:hypothetical protein
MAEGAGATAKADAIEFLTEMLANGPITVTQIESEARAACLLGADQPIASPSGG